MPGQVGVVRRGLYDINILIRSLVQYQVYSHAVIRSLVVNKEIYNNRKKSLAFDLIEETLH